MNSSQEIHDVQRDFGHSRRAGSAGGRHRNRARTNGKRRELPCEWNQTGLTMTQLTQDLLSAYTMAVAHEAATANSDLFIHRAFRLEAAKVRVRETRARLIDHLGEAGGNG